MSETRKRLYLLSAAMLAGILLCEAGLRVFDFSRGRSQDARAFWYWLYEQDPYLGWRGRPLVHAVTDLDVITHNDDGFRDGRDLSSLVRLAAGRRLVLCVGESSTYGISAGSNDRTYPADLERELRSLSGDDRWLVYNAGMPGYTSHEVMEEINLHLLKLSPEIIVEMNLANDHDYMGTYLDETTDYNHLPIRLAPMSRSTVRDLLMRSSLFAFIATRLRFRLGDDLGGRWFDAPHDRPTARGMKLYRDNLSMTALLAKRSGVQLMLVDQPIDYTGLASGEVGSYEDLRSVLKEFTRDEGVPLLRAHSVLDWSGLQIHQMLHLGRTGYERLAKLLAPQIIASASAVQSRRGADAGR